MQGNNRALLLGHQVQVCLGQIARRIGIALLMASRIRRCCRRIGSQSKSCDTIRSQLYRSKCVLMLFIQSHSMWRPAITKTRLMEQVVQIEKSDAFRYGRATRTRQESAQADAFCSGEAAEQHLISTLLSSFAQETSILGTLHADFSRHRCRFWDAFPPAPAHAGAQATSRMGVRPIPVSFSRPIAERRVPGLSSA